VPTPPFVRDRITILSYGAVGAYAYYLYALGPVLAFLHRELDISYTLTSLHSALWAGGTVLTGLVFGSLVRRFGRRGVLWASVAGTAGGALLFSVSHHVGLTLLATGLLGIAGSLVQTATTVILADRHGGWRERALVEGGVMAAAAAVLAPVVLGSLDRTNFGWRAGMLLPVLALGALWLVFRHDRLPAAPATPVSGVSGVGSGRLPRQYWPLAILVAVVVGIEFSMVLYGAVLLDDDRGFSTASAATAMSVFYVGILSGRIAGAGLTRRAGRITLLLLCALATTTAGFTVFWLSTFSAVAIVGLFLVGLGVANLYPLTVALAVARAPGQTDQAAARTQLLIGVAVIAAPLTLGALADEIGVFRAFAVEPVLIAVAMFLLLVSSRAAQPREAARL